ncbi:unnamed protein product, partial [Staurois parvus]
MTEPTSSALSMIGDPLCPRDTAHRRSPRCVLPEPCMGSENGRTSYDVLPEGENHLAPVIVLYGGREVVNDSQN